MSILAQLLLLLATLATAAPTAESVQIGTASLRQVAQPNYKFNGADSIYKTYLKYKVPVPAWLEKAARDAGHMAKRVQGSVVASAIDSIDKAYTIPVEIGTPAQTLNLELDTGSSDMWVFSSLTPSRQVQGQTVYNPSRSSTAKRASGETWKISYGDGSSSSGTVYIDKVFVGGVSVATQPVEVATTVSSSFTSNSKIDGLIGLGFDTLNAVRPRTVPTFFDNAKSSLDSPLFTCDLKYKSPGTYDFGYIDSGKYSGSITYVPVNRNTGYWTFTSTGYAVGSGSFTSTSITGIADTGTTLMYLPAAQVRAYYAHVPGSSNSNAAGGYVFPCSAANTLPSFTFGVAGARITIPGRYMDFGQITTGSSQCFGGIQSSDDLGINVFGDVALKAAFVVFNGAASPTIGWANKTLT